MWLNYWLFCCVFISKLKCHQLKKYVLKLKYQIRHNIIKECKPKNTFFVLQCSFYLRGLLNIRHIFNSFISYWFIINLHLNRKYRFLRKMELVCFRLARHVPTGNCIKCILFIPLSQVRNLSTQLGILKFI